MLIHASNSTGLWGEKQRSEIRSESAVSFRTHTLWSPQRRADLLFIRMDIRLRIYIQVTQQKWEKSIFYIPNPAFM